MSTTDVHRMIDSKLPAGKACTGITMIEVYTAIIDGVEISVDAPLLNGGYSMGPEAVADLIVAQIGSTDNAAPEGGEVDMVLEAKPGPSPDQARNDAPAFFRDPHPPPLDYDDGSDDEEDFVGDEPLFEEPEAPEPAHARKPKKKAKAKRR